MKKASHNLFKSDPESAFKIGNFFKIILIILKITMPRGGATKA
jgi:hypothetical protein